jgi:predicted acetyltransferase
MTLAVLPVSPAEHTLLRNLYPLYLHDLSEFGGGYSLDAQGLWQPDYLPYWLSGKEGCHPLLFRLDGRPVGFALVGQAPFPFMTPGRDFHLSEFFVLRGERRHGLGRRAAFALFDRFPGGTWELSQLPANQGATAFWRRVIGEYMAGDFEDTPLEGGPGQVFDSRKRARPSR